MKFHSIAIAALAVVSFGANAALTTLTPADGWPPLGSTGLENVQFNVASGAGALIAAGAHAYKEGSFLPSNGIDTFYANQGYSPDVPTNARWSFDYVVNYAAGKTAADYWTVFSFDADPTEAVVWVSSPLNGSNCGTAGPGGSNICGITSIADSNGPVFIYGALEGFTGFHFDPTAAGSYGFKVSLYDAGGTNLLATTAITVEVPEPGTLALAGLALAGLAAARRRKA